MPRSSHNFCRTRAPATLGEEIANALSNDRLEHDGLADLNPQATQAITAQLEPALRNAHPKDRFQFERHGYFVADHVDSRPGALVFNRAVTLKDSCAKSNG